MTSVVTEIGGRFLGRSHAVPAPANLCILGTFLASLAMVSGRIISIVAAIALAAFVGGYVWSPFHALETLGSAVRTSDRDALSVAVDFPAVRAGLKDQFAAKLASETTHDKAIAKNPL